MFDRTHYARQYAAMYSFGDLLKAAMERHGWTVRQLAAELDVDQRNITRWRASKVGPNAQTVLEIAEAMDIDIDELIPRRQGSASPRVSSAQAEGLDLLGAAGDAAAEPPPDEEAPPSRRRRQSPRR